MKKIWEIPRSDKKDRCGKCLITYRKGQFRYKRKELKGYRYEAVCAKCLTL